MLFRSIGLSRTGTTSLNSSLQILGYNAKHFPEIKTSSNGIYIPDNELNKYDAFSDTPVALLYKKLDKLYSGSKFIYTIRQVDDWLISCANYPRFDADYKIDREITTLRYQLFNCTHYNQRLFVKAYNKHNSDVLRYFKNRPADFLELNICAGEGWSKLCAFLDRSIPDKEFPKENNSNLL